MTISSAMQAGVSGLRANSEAVGRISENIANAGTVGYKRTFASMVTTTAGNSSGVRAEYGSDVNKEGSTQTSTSGSALAVTGEGFFVVSRNPNDPNPNNYMLTRAGDFRPDNDGNMVNSAGYYLSGFRYDEEGSLGGIDRTTFDSMTTVNVSSAKMSADATSEADIAGNLPSTLTGTGVVQPPFVSSMPYHNALGEKEALTLTWTPSDTTSNLWSLQVAGKDGTVYGNIDIEFHDSGATPAAPLSYVGTQDPGLAAPAAFAVDADGNITITIDNATAPQTIDIALGGVGTYDGITQFAGDYEPQRNNVNGSGVSPLASTEIDEKGNVWGVFENGKRSALYQIPVATVPSPDNLKLVTGNAYLISRDSGPAVFNEAGSSGVGDVLANALESSNVDIAQEMTDLIQVQRYYSSNAKIITTADEMLQETNNLKR